MNMTMTAGQRCPNAHLYREIAIERNFMYKQWDYASCASIYYKSVKIFGNRFGTEKLRALTTTPARLLGYGWIFNDYFIENFILNTTVNEF